MPIAFEQIPENILVPLFYAEVAPAAEPISPGLRVCLIGFKNTLGTVNIGTGVTGKLYLLTEQRASELFGAGSMLHWMYQAARAQAPFVEIWGIAVDEADYAIAASATITIANAPSARRSGFMRIYIAGRPVDCRVFPDDTTADVAQRLRTAINAQALPVRARATTNVITLTCRWNGTSGNDIVVSTRSRSGDSDRLAESLTTMTTMAGGTGEHVVTQALDVIGDIPFDIFVAAPLPSVARTAFGNFMDNISGRWSPYKQLYGHVVTAAKADYASAITLGTGLNDPHMTFVSYDGSPQTQWEWASALGAVMAVHWAAPPEISRPIQTLVLKGIWAPWQESNWYSIEQRQLLLEQGISTFTVQADGSVEVDRVRTLRKFSPNGELDPSWADAITMFQAMYFVRDMRRSIKTAYPRAALTDLPTDINGFVSPQNIAATIIGNYSRLEKLGLVENVGLFSKGLVVERNASQANRVDCFAPPDFVNQFRIFAVMVETHLELTQNIGNVPGDDA